MKPANFVFSPYRLISLADMIQFYAESFFPVWERLQNVWIDAEKCGKQGQTHVPDGLREEVVQILKEVKVLCGQLELPSSEQRQVLFYRSITDSLGMHLLTLQTEITSLQATITHELSARKFAFIPPLKAEFFEPEIPFGERFDKEFPQVKQDARHASNCIAADLNTAAVFYLMRIAECGLHRIAKPLLGTVKGNIDYDTWGKILAKMSDKLTKYKKHPMTKAKEVKILYYSELMMRIRDFMHLWRNPVSHFRGQYNELQARDAFNQIRAFMQTLAG